MSERDNWTTHGHHIPGKSLLGAPGIIPRCEGIGKCEQCTREAWPEKTTTEPKGVVWTAANTEWHNDGTILVVFRALRNVLTEDQTLDAIRVMQNEGILFRQSRSQI